MPTAIRHAAREWIRPGVGLPHTVQQLSGPDGRDDCLRLCLWQTLLGPIVLRRYSGRQLGGPWGREASRKDSEAPRCRSKEDSRVDCVLVRVMSGGGLKPTAEGLRPRKPRDSIPWPKALSGRL